MLHWHGDWRCKIRLLSFVQLRAKWTGVAKPQTRKGAFLWCELGLQEWQFAKLEADEDYGEALQARARARIGGARLQNAFLLMCKATA